jgi:CRISPR system Cascade subunit CasA
MLNLINDPWIPVIRAGVAAVIRPDQIANADVERLDWPRADLNLACMELLIGLVYLAHPCTNRATPPDAATLHAALAPLAPAFNLLGDGPRFLQDMDPLEGEPNPPDMLFIDSAGTSTAKKNADLMVHRGRYQDLPLPLAAMALYTLQAFAPSGGAGNRTSMRGGGPMVTLVRPEADGLWPLIWANVPHGTTLPASDLHKLPWMRETVSSKPKGVVMVPDEGSQSALAPEVFFGQPRRLRLVAEGGMVTGIIQQTYGNNYQQWRHPLSPYYTDAKGQTLPVHPKPGGFGYRNWRGVLLTSKKGLKPQTLTTYLGDMKAAKCSLIVAGWAMDNMKPQDFIWSQQPVFTLSEEAEFAATDMVEAAEAAGYALKNCVTVTKGADDNRALAALEGFYSATQAPFEALLAKMAADGVVRNEAWLQALRKAALAEFDAAVLPGLPDLAESKREGAINARGKLVAAFSGFGLGKKIFTPLGLVATKKKETV